MGSQYGEWIADVERCQFVVQQDAASGRVPVVSGEVFVKLPGASSSRDQDYAGSHALYQDVTVPSVPDGASNTFMFAEKFQGPDGEYVLAAVQHYATQASSGGGEDSFGLWQINAEPSEASLHKGGWICDVTYEHSPTGTAVAIETITIAHEGMLLL